MDNMTFKWDIGLLNKLVGLCYKKNQYITIFSLRNLQKLMRESDFSKYMNKSQIIRRVDFIKRTLEAKLDHKFADDSIIINYASEDIDDPIISDIVNNIPKYKNLSHSEITYLNTMIEDRLKYGIVQRHFDKIVDIIERVNSGEFSTYAQAFLWVEDWIRQFQLDSRRIKSEINNGVLRFNDPNIEERVQDILDKLGSTNSIIISGIQMLNDILFPGYRGGKLYTYAALPANFKSGLLLKTALDCIKYNAKSYRGKKDSHKKAVVYFTMENTTPETFERTFNMLISRDSVTSFTSSHIVAELRKADIIGNDDMELIVVYKPNRSITTDDIRYFIEELDEVNTEVVMLCFDYIKRIRPAEKASNEKEELKNVTNELRQIGIDFDIPVVSAAQLNRQAATILNSVARSGKADALKEIDSSQIGSAWEIVENSDVVILINMQRRKKDGALFLSFMCVKQRYNQPDRTYFNQPFDTKTFNLVDDIMDDKPKGIVRLAADFEDVDMDEYTKKGRKVHTGGKPINVVNDVFDLSPLS
jgi:replicative DNA helicase